MHYIVAIPIILGIMGALVGLLWLFAAGPEKDGGPDTNFFVIFGCIYIFFRVPRCADIGVVSRYSGGMLTLDAPAEILCDVIDSPVGRLLARVSDAALVELSFVDPSQAAALPPRDSHPVLMRTRQQLGEYFAGRRTSFDLPLRPQGSGFEMRAWDYLKTIPFGQTRTYGQQAAGIGDPHAARAVGKANGANRIAIIIPCHRVIGAGGKLVGYGGGLDRKRWLLDHERR